MYLEKNEIPSRCSVYVFNIRGLIQSPCGKINVIMTLGGRGSQTTFYNCIVSTSRL